MFGHHIMNYSALSKENVFNQPLTPASQFYTTSLHIQLNILILKTMGCSISCERGEPEDEIVEGYDVSSTPYLFGFDIWCCIKPFARQFVNHDQLPDSNEPADISLHQLRPLSQPTTQDVFSAEWQRTGGRADVPLSRPEPMAEAERSHHISSTTYFPHSSALLALGDLEYRLLQLCGLQGSRERLLSPGSQLEVDRLWRQIRHLTGALEHSAQQANSEHERLIRHGHARRPLASSAASSTLQSEIGNSQQPNQDQGPSTPYPQYPNFPPPAYSIWASE